MDAAVPIRRKDWPPPLSAVLGAVLLVIVDVVFNVESWLVFVGGVAIYGLIVLPILDKLSKKLSKRQSRPGGAFAQQGDGRP